MLRPVRRLGGRVLPVPGPVTPQLVALYGAAVEAGEEPDEDSPEAVGG